MTSYCSPSHEEIYDKTKTCYTKDQLVFIAKKYNNTRKDKRSHIKLNTLKKELLHQLHNKLKVNEHEWNDLSFMKQIQNSKKNELKESFKPDQPKEWKLNPREWLNTNDIDNVMGQYEKKYPSFKFLGVMPIDFEHKVYGIHCVNELMCTFDVKSMLDNGVTQCGSILNLDYHYQSGSHWVCMYIGLTPSNRNFGLYYVNSSGSKAPNEVYAFYRKVKTQMNEIYPKEIANRFKLKENKKQFQFKNTECGMFSMYFMINFLEQKSFKSIVNSKINDETAFMLRDRYYIP